MARGYFEKRSYLIKALNSEPAFPVDMKHFFGGTRKRRNNAKPLPGYKLVYRRENRVGNPYAHRQPADP
jgi:hypothetical protein